MGKPSAKPVFTGYRQDLLVVYRNRVIVAVAAIKADVLRFGLGDRELYAT